MSRTVDVLIEAEDNASQVMEDFGDTVEDVTDRASEGFLGLKAAILGVTAGSEMLNRQQQRITEQLRRTAHFIGSTEDRMRDMAVAIADVTRPVNDVVAGMDALQKRGINSEEQMATLIHKYDQLADSMGTDIPSAIYDASRMLAGFGGTVEDIVHIGDEFAHIMNTTEVNVRQMARTMGRRRSEIQALGMDMNDAMVVLKALGEEFQDAYAMRSAFRDAINVADGSMRNFLDSLGLTVEEFEAYREELEGVEGEMAKLAEMHADSYTLMQRGASIIDKMKTEYHELFEILSTVSSIVVTVGMTLFFAEKGLLAMKKAGTLLVGVLTGTLLPKLKALATALVTKKALIVAIPAVIAYAVDRITDESRRIESEIDNIDDALQRLGSSMDDVEDFTMPRGARRISEADEVEDLVRRVTGETITIETEEDMEEAMELLRQGREQLEEDLEDADGGIVSRLISRAMESAGEALSAINFTDMIHGLLDNVEDFLFDEWDYEELVHEMTDLGEDAEPTIGAELDRERIEGILDDYADYMESISLKSEVLEFKEFEELEKRADKAYTSIERLLDAGLSPTSSEVENLLGDFLKLASHMEEGEEKTHFLNDAFTRMVNAGLRPATEGYDELAQKVREANDSVEDITEAEQRRDLILQELEREIEIIENTADAQKALDSTWDKSEAKAREYESAFRQLLQVHEVAEDEIEMVTIKLDKLNASESELTTTLRELRNERIEAILLDNMMGEQYDSTRDVVNTAETALRELSLAVIHGKKSTEEISEEWEFWNRVLDETDISPVVEDMKNISEQLGIIEEQGLYLEWDEEDIVQQQLSEVDRQIRRAIDEQEHLNEETGEYTEEFQKLLDLLEYLNQELQDIEDARMPDYLVRAKDDILDLKESIALMPDLGEALGWDDEEVIEKQLSDVDAIIRTMVDLDRDRLELADGRIVKLDEMIDKKAELEEKIYGVKTGWEEVSAELARQVPIVDSLLEALDVDFSEQINIGIDVATDFLEEQMMGLGGRFAELAGFVDPVTAVFFALINYSEPFSDLMEIINNILSAVVDALTGFLRPLVKLWQIIETAVVPVLDMLGQIVASVLLPAFLILEPALRTFGIVLSYVAEGIGRAFNVLLGIIDTLAFWTDLSDWEVDIDSIRDARRQLIEGIEDEQEARADATAELHHVPRGFKENLRRFQAMGEGQLGETVDPAEDEWNTLRGSIENGAEMMDNAFARLFWQFQYDGIIGGLASGSELLQKHGLPDVLGQMTERVADFYEEGARERGIALDTSSREIEESGKKASESIETAGTSVSSSLSSAGNAISSATGTVAQGLGSVASGIASGVSSAFGTMGDAISGVVSFHEGGIIGGTRGSERLILAQAGEAVLPIDIVEELKRAEEQTVPDMISREKMSPLQRFTQALGEVSDPDYEGMDRLIPEKTPATATTEGALGTPDFSGIGGDTTSNVHTEINEDRSEHKEIHHHHSYNFNGTKIVTDDPEELFREFKRMAKEERYKQTGTIVESDNKYNQ